MEQEISPKWADGGRFGSVRLYTPSDGQRSLGLVMLVSDKQGWDANAVSLASRLVDEGRVVLGINLPTYLPSLSREQGKCSWVNGDFESLARKIERDMAFGEFHEPIVAGVGTGSVIAYAAVEQVLPNTFSGGMGVGFTPAFDIGRRLCLPIKSEFPLRYGPGSGATPWLFTPASDFTSTDSDQQAFLAAMPHAYRIDASDGIAAFDRAILMLTELNVSASLAGFPIYELPPKQGGTVSHPVVIMYSGDGGWRDIDRQLGAYLADKGFFVVGIDSLRYFWRQKTSSEMASDLDQIIRHYSSRGNGIILAGYSFGADILPFIFNKLTSGTQHKIKLISLLGISRHASFQIRVSNILGAQNTDGPPILPELSRIRDMPVLCIYGSTEADTVCTSNDLDRAIKPVEIKGGHHFDGDYRDVADAIASAGAIEASPSQGKQ